MAATEFRLYGIRLGESCDLLLMYSCFVFFV